ncbi:MAG: hypothetical protein PHU43_03400 [Candidatus Bipolaricaulis sp.]|nr:hypothetical protein [Candidatus Bipolaricaulis sp.]
MSVSELVFSIRAVNRTSSTFARVKADAQTTTQQIKNMGLAMAGVAASGLALVHIANSFGLIDDETTKTVSSVLMLVSVMGLFMNTSIGVAAAQKVYSAACAIATAVQNALNISYATFLALTGVGIAVIAAAAVAMYAFSQSMNTATSSVQNFNNATAQTTTNARNIQRSGDLTIYRQGIEDSP